MARRAMWRPEVCRGKEGQRCHFKYVGGGSHLFSFYTSLGQEGGGRLGEGWAELCRGGGRNSGWKSFK
jgi:hypothetical protein